MKRTSLAGDVNASKVQERDNVCETVCAARMHIMEIRCLSPLPESEHFQKYRTIQETKRGAAYSTNRNKEMKTNVQAARRMLTEECVLFTRARMVVTY